MAINFRNRTQVEGLKKLGDGGEAVVYEYDSKRAVKLFKPKVNCKKKEKVVKFFISIKDKLSKKVIAPEEECYINGEFSAYLMRMLIGSEDIHVLVSNKHIAAEHLTNKDILEIVTNLGKEIAKLHQFNENGVKGLLVGDISDYNFKIVGKTPYLIDVDSWGAIGNFTPSAYTERYTCPDSYKPDGTIEFSVENENYNFAVLAFFLLTQMHPFEGKYLKEKMSITERMKRKISVVGAHKADIKPPGFVKSWNWMSPKLLKDFEEIFEQGKRFDITPDLEELLNNLKYCDKHGVYYYSKYSECPICNEKAKVKAAPIVAKATQSAGGPKICVVFSEKDCAYILSSLHYLNRNNEAVHFTTGRKFTVERGKRVEFSEDGKVVYVISNDFIEIYDGNSKKMSTIERMYNTNYVVKDRDIYYIDKASNLMKVTVTKNGNMPKNIMQVYNPIFTVSDDGKVFAVSMYPKTAIITTPDYNFEVDYTGRINEYAIKYDKAKNKWLFVYQLPNGKYRTMVFYKNKIEYDDDLIMYNARPLSNIDFYNNTIYDPADAKIIGTNISKNTAKEFDCGVVNETSVLEFTGKGFKIYNQDNIYNYG